MPNYVKNIVRFDKSVPDSEFLSFLSRVMTPKEGGAALPASAESVGDEGETATHAITVRDFGNMGLNFNTLVPMPKALDITSGSDTDEGLLLYTACSELPDFCCSYIAMMPSWDRLFHGRTKDDIAAEYRTYAKIIHPDTNKSTSQAASTAAMAILNRLYSDAIDEPSLPTVPTPSGTFCETFLQSIDKLWASTRLVRSMQEAGCCPHSPDALLKFRETAEGARLCKLGEKAYSNKKKYGSATWYEWCPEHWGTKWNAMETSFDLEERKLSFTTAWAAPEPIVEALVKAFPRIDFVWNYADENCACNTGRFIHKNGALGKICFPNKSQEAYQMYADCWGPSECMYQNEEGEWGRYDCDSCPNPC